MNDLKTPVTIDELCERINTTCAELEKAKTFTFDGIDISAIMATANNTTINNICTVEDFNTIFEAVKNGNTIKVIIDGTVCVASSADYTEVASDSYKYICFTFIGPFKTITDTSTTKVFKFALELLAGSIRLCDKSVVGIA